MKINARTIPVLLQNLKGKNLRTGKVKGLRRNAHRIKNTNRERPMPLSKSVHLVIVVARKVSKIRQRKAITVTGKVSRTEKLGALTYSQRNAKNFYLMQVILGVVVYEPFVMSSTPVMSVAIRRAARVAPQRLPADGPKANVALRPIT